MYRVDLYARVRRACRVEGMSTREASRVFGLELYPQVDGAVKSCWPMACLYRSLRFGEEYLPVSALLVDKT